VNEAFARRRQHAEGIVAWIDRMNSPPPDERDIGLFLYIRNDSTAPIHELYVTYSTGSGFGIPVLGPGKEVHLGLDRVVGGTLQFMDSTGRVWERPIDGGRPRRKRTRV